MSKKVILIPLSNNTDNHSLVSSPNKGTIEVSQKEFNKRFADTARSIIVDGRLTTTYHDTQTNRSQFMGGSYKVK